jgi:transcriptional regulator
MEAPRSDPWKLKQVQSYAERIAPGTTGFRLDPTRLVGKAKLSQDLPAEQVERLARAVRRDHDGLPANPSLADAMLAANGVS